MFVSYWTDASHTVNGWYNESLPCTDTLHLSCCSQNQSLCLSDSYRDRRSCVPTGLWDTAGLSCRHTRWVKLHWTLTDKAHSAPATKFDLSLRNSTFSRSSDQSSFWDIHRCNHERSSASLCTLTRAHRGLMSTHRCSCCHSSLRKWKNKSEQSFVAQ